MTRTLHCFFRAALLAAAVVSPAPAANAWAAETPAPPPYLGAYNLTWVDYVDPADLPATRYATCIVDSGAVTSPDLPADSPAGPVLERLAVDGGPGAPQGDAPEQLHGSRMAMAAVAPANGWGTIGAAAWTRVVSVRAQVEHELTFRRDSYRKGIDTCKRALDRHPLAAVSLSLGCDCDIDPDEVAKLQDAIARARDNGMSVVAAAGNTAGAATEVPARYPGVFAVSGGDGSGGLCSYTSFDADVDLIGPACPVQLADALTGDPYSTDGGGSSAATAVTASFITALRSLRPAANADQVEQWLRQSARSVGGRPVLDGEAAARLAGLGDVVDRAKARMPAPTGDPSPTPTVGATPTATPTVPDPGVVDGPPGSDHLATVDRFHRPRHARARWRDGRLVVTVRARPTGARLEILAEQTGELGLARRRLRATAARKRLVLSPAWRPDRVRLQFVPAREFAPRASRPRILVRRPSGRFT